MLGLSEFNPGLTRRLSLAGSSFSRLTCRPESLEAQAGRLELALNPSRLDTCTLELVLRLCLGFVAKPARPWPASGPRPPGRGGPGRGGGTVSSGPGSTGTVTVAAGPSHGSTQT